MEKNNNTIIWAVVIIVVLGIILFFAFGNKKETADDVIPTPSEQTETPATTEPESTEDVALGATAASISYANALIKYADRRIQLDPICQAHPNTVTYKDNTGIMIDNRSAQTRTVKAGITVTIKPWGFKIVTLPDIYLKSKTILVDCDKSQNVATILVQE